MSRNGGALARATTLVALSLTIAHFGSASSLVSTSNSGYAFYSSSSFYTHFASGRFWVAFYDGSRPVLFSSPDGASWSSQGNIFSSFSPASAGQWAVRYSLGTVVAFGYNSGDTNRYYRVGTLNADGTVTWNAPDAAVTGVTGTAMKELNALIVNGKPVMWRAGLTDNGRFTIGSAMVSPVWTDSADAPSLAAATGGAFAGGAIFPTGGADPNDLIVLRATTLTTVTAASHRLVSVKYDAGTGTFDPSWYVVSTLDGTLTENNITEIRNVTEAENQRDFAAVRDASGNLHAIMINRNGDAAHYKKDVGFNDNWTRVSSDVTQVAGTVSKVALTAAGGDHLYLYYEKSGDGTLWYRRFDGTTWGPETFVYTATDLHQALAPIETLGGCSAALAWEENTSTPYDITFSLDAAPCTPLSVTLGANTIGVTAAGSFEWVFDDATGGGPRYFYDLAVDPGRSFDLAAGVSSHENYFIDEVRDQATATNYRTDQNDYGAELDLLEATPTRVVVRQESFYEQNGGPNVLGGIKGVGRYSIYPSGKMALDWTRSTMRTINYGFQELQHSVHYRDPGTAPYDGWTFYTDNGSPAPSLPIPPLKTFTLMRSDVPGQMVTDFLNVPYQDWPLADAVVLATDDAQERAELSFDENGTGTLNPGTESWSWLSYFKPTTFGDNTDPNVTKRRDDYRSPDSLSIMTGTGWNAASEHSSGDNFNEAEGIYVLTFDPTLGLQFAIDGATTNRFDPAFKIRQWRSLSDPPSVTLDGTPLVNDVDFRADVKPVARGHFAQELDWHSTLESSAAVTSPDVGTGGTVVSNDFVAARYGNGARFDADGERITFPQAGNFDSAEGAIEFWYQPTYDFGADKGDPTDDFGFFGYYIDNNDFFSAYYQPNEGATTADDGLKFVIHSGGTSFSVETGVPPSSESFWRAYDWVHLRFVWDSSPQRLEIWVNGKKVTGATIGSYPAPAAMGPDISIGDRVYGPTYGLYGNNAEGIIDEFHVYSSADAPTANARGGFAGDASEYLATGARNFSYALSGLDGVGRGEYAYFGSDSEFRGLNVALATAGVGTGLDLKWQYWNGAQWADLESGFSFTDGTSHFTTDGTLHWTDPAGWAPYSVNGGPDLYYVRASLLSGSYSTVPVEGVIRTDILLFQYCGTIDVDNRTFVFGVPAPTAVELAGFEADPRDGAVALSWATASELDNLGFDLYRSVSRDGRFEKITPRTIPGLGSSPVGASYRYLDAGLINGTTYYYRLEDVDTEGRRTPHGPIAATPFEGAPSDPEDDPTGEATSTTITYGEPETTELRTVRRDGGGAVFELRTNGFYAEPNDEGAVSITVPGLEELDVAGGPALPVARFWVDAVPGRKVELAFVRAAEVERFSGLRPSNEATEEIRATHRGTVRIRRVRAAGPFQSASLVPSDWARVVTVAFQGERKKALIEIAPLRWDGATGEILLARRVELRLSFAGRESSETAEGARGRRRPSFLEAKSTSPALARLVARERGLYAVRFEDLFGRRGRRFSIAKLRLGRLGEAVPFHVSPDGVFGPGATLYFWSEGAASNPYDNEVVYELAQGAGGDVMEEPPPPPGRGPNVIRYAHTERREENRYYQAGLVSREDPWLWDVLLAPERKSFEVRVDHLAPAEPAGSPGRLLVWMQGASDVPDALDHHLRLYLNDVFLAEASWEGKFEERLDAEVPDGVLHEGENRVTLENVGDAGAAYSMVMLDRFELTYERQPVASQGTLEGTWNDSGTTAIEGLPSGSFLLDLTGGEPRWLGSSPSPVSLTAAAGHHYVATAPSSVHKPEVRDVPRVEWKRETRRADYLIVAPEALVDATRPLAELRRSQGLAVETVPLESLYSEFGFGEKRPEALREFLAYAYHQWRKPSPRYVVLVGDASYDFKDYLGTGTASLLPPFLVRTSLLWTASDPAYAAINGDDDLPDLALGRLPAASAKEAAAMVAKIVSYETGETGGTSGGEPLAGPVVLVADNTDPAGNFEKDAEEIAREVLTRDVRRIYLGTLGAARTRQEIRDAFERGGSLVSYLGHGGIHLWAEEDVFDNGDVDELRAPAQLPVVLTMNCLNGYFHFPYFDSLAEKLVKSEGKGAIAAFAPSGLSLHAPARLYHRALVEEIFSGRHDRLGDALVAAQEAYASRGAYPELLAIYQLLGDPALRIR